MEKAFVAQGVATKLFDSEQAIDAALVKATTLLQGMIEARAQGGYSAVVGASAQAKVVEAIAALSEARSAIVASHDELADLKLRLGIRTKLIGVTDKDRNNGVSPAQHLQAVGD